MWEFASINIFLTRLLPLKSIRNYPSSMTKARIHLTKQKEPESDKINMKTWIIFSFNSNVKGKTQTADNHKKTSLKIWILFFEKINQTQ